MNLFKITAPEYQIIYSIFDINGKYLWEDYRKSGELIFDEIEIELWVTFEGFTTN